MSVDATNSQTPKKRRPRRRRGGSSGQAGAGGDTRPAGGVLQAEPLAEPKIPAVLEGCNAVDAASVDGQILAAIDIGTNNCRLLIARQKGEDFEVIDAFSRIVRLGEGVALTGKLSEAAMSRTIDALKICAKKMRRHRGIRVRVVATEACRRARNGRDFVERARRETGLRIDVISPEEEARLAVAGCAPLTDPEAEQLLVFDIGGGSTELIWVDLSTVPSSRRRSLVKALAPPGRGRPIDSARARAAEAHIADWVSIPMGVATLYDQFSGFGDEPARFDSMRRAFTEGLSSFASKGFAPTPERLSRLQLLGTSGTVTTLAGVHLGLPRYDRSRVDGLWLGSKALFDVTSRLLTAGLSGRAEIPCVGADRAEFVMSGAAILNAIMMTWPSPRVRVADRGLREGLLYGLMQTTGGKRAKGSARHGA